MANIGKAHIALAGFPSMLSGTEDTEAYTHDVPNLVAQKQEIEGLTSRRILDLDEMHWTQSDWSGGEGQEFWKLNDEHSDSRYHQSTGIDVGEQGMFRLAPKGVASSKTGPATMDKGGLLVPGDYPYTVETDEVWRWNATTSIWESVSSGGGTTEKLDAVWSTPYIFIVRTGGGYFTFVAASSQYITTPDTTALDPSNGDDFYVECWFRITANPGAEQVLVSKKTAAGTANAGYALLVNSGGAIVLRVSDGSSAEVVLSGGAVILDAWNHAALVCDGVAAGSDNYAVYLNGTSVASGSQSVGAKSNAVAFEVGRYAGGTGYFNGNIVSVQFDKSTLLSAANVAADHALGAFTIGPYAGRSVEALHWNATYLPSYPGTGTTVTDVGGLGGALNGTLTAGVTWTGFADIVRFDTRGAGTWATWTSAVLDCRGSEGIAIHRGRLYVIADAALYAIATVGTAGTVAAEKVYDSALLGTSPTQSYHDGPPWGRYRIWPVDGGVQFFINHADECEVHEYREGVGGKVIARLPRGMAGQAGWYYLGVTYVSAISRAPASVSETGDAFIFAIQQGQLNGIGYIRQGTLTASPIVGGPAVGADQYLLHNSKVWRYDTALAALQHVCDLPSTVHDVGKFPGGWMVVDRELWASSPADNATARVQRVVLDANYPTSGTQDLISSIYDFDLPADRKLLLGFVLEMEAVPAAGNSVQIFYKLDRATSWTSAGTIDSAEASPYEIDLTASTKVFTNIQWRALVVSDSASETPEGLSVTTLVRAQTLAKEKRWMLNIDLQKTNELGLANTSPRQQLANLDALASTGAIFNFDDGWKAGGPNATRHVVVLRSMTQRLTTPGGTNQQPQGSVTVELVAVT